MDISIKKEYQDEIVGYNPDNKRNLVSTPLGQRPDLPAIALLALRTDNPELLKYFEKIPTLEELEKAAANNFLEKNPLPASTPAKTVAPGQTGDNK